MTKDDRVRGVAYECGYIYASDEWPEQSFRHFIYDAAMSLKSTPTADAPTAVKLTEGAHFMHVADDKDYPGKALVKWAFKLTGAGQQYIINHFDQLKAIVIETAPAGVYVHFPDLLEKGKGNKITGLKFGQMGMNTLGSELFEGNSTFTDTFGGGSSDNRGEAVVEQPLPPLWYGVVVPMVYELNTGTLLLTAAA